MKYVPHDYQAYCIQRVVENPAVGLFLRPGLGKTVITLSAVNILKYFRWQVQKVLVVAPKKVAEATWSKEAAKWDHLQHLRTSVVLGSATKRIKALNTPADIYVINRENVEWLVDYYKQAWPFDMVVLDESTSFKNSQSKRWKAMRRVRRFIKRMVLLTGTPSSKGLIDLWAQVYLLDCGERLGQSLSAYRERYFDPDQRSRTQIFSYKAKDGAESAVLDAISDICISMKAEDYLELPDFIQHEVPVLLDAKARRAYDQFERDLLLEVDEDVITAASAAVLVGKLLQMCNGAVYSNDGHIVPVHDCKLEAYENKETGKREIYIAQDGSHINQWGVLQYYEKLDSKANAKAMADALLDLYNTKTRTLKLQDVLGDIRVRAGTLLVVMLGLGDINVSNYLMAEQVKHTFNDGQHLMELKMRGGTFVA